MVDTSNIDLCALIERHASIRFGKAVSRDSKQTRKGGPCPFCGLGNDRFAVFINESPQRYYCGIHGNGCNARGDAIDFIREYLSVGYIEACEHLEIDPDSEYVSVRCKNAHTNEEPPSKKWMERAEVFCLESKALLWSEQGERALDWLRARGLTDATIKQFGLGLNLTRGYQDKELWGMSDDVWVTRGIVIPWAVNRQIWKVNIRRSDKDIAAENARLRALKKKENAAKYRQVSGGTNGLYNADLIQPEKPLIMVEGEFDGLALLQATNRQYAVAATGSTGSARDNKWVEAIQRAGSVLIAFDDDENKAGDSAASFWLGKIPQSIRWLPWSHDINDMLREGKDIQNWITLGLDVYKVMQSSKDEEQVLASILAQAEPPLCGPCLDSGVETVATHEDEDGNMFCERHFLRQPETTEIVEQDMSMTQEQFVDHAMQVIGAIIPGQIEVHIDLLGYTIEQRAREFAQEQEGQRKAAYRQAVRSRRRHFEVA